MPGQQVQCACPGGAQGVQVCATDGSQLYPCDCTNAMVPPGEEDEQHKPTHAFLISPLGILVPLIIGMVNIHLEYQVAFHDYVGMSVKPQFVYWDIGNFEGYGGGGELGPRILLSGDKLAGWFIYPVVSLAWVKGEYEGEKSTAEADVGAFGVGGDIGYQWAWTPGFILGLSGGIQYLKLLGDAEDLDLELRIPVYPRLNLMMGYGF